MSTTKTETEILISPRGTKALLQAGIESVPAESGLEAMRAPADAEEAARFRAGLEQALAEMEDHEDREGVLFVADHGMTSLLQTYLTEEARKHAGALAAEGKLVPAQGGGFEAKFNDRDLTGWVASFFTWWRRAVDKHPFLGPPEAPDKRIGNDARIAVLGDWGTALYGAPVCADTVKNASPRFDMLLHLGDVYYSGTPKEVQTRFLDFWPDVPGALSRAVNSNHEMYSGGHGFFQKTLPAFEQAASCFAVENDHFLLVGLDTGYDEHDLAGPQVPWLERLVKGAEDKGQRVVLFSHHQPFSIFEKQGPKLVERLRPLLEARRIFAWYWGHEHRAVIYDEFEPWGLHGRLIGHSGYPYFRDKVQDRPIAKENPDGSQWRRFDPSDEDKAHRPSARVLDGPNKYLGSDKDKYGPQGFLTLHLSGKKIVERVLAANGAVLLEQEIGG